MQENETIASYTDDTESVNTEQIQGASGDLYVSEVLRVNLETLDVAASHEQMDSQADVLNV